MKKIIVLIFIYASIFHAQSDPLSGNYTLGEAAEVVLTWNVNRSRDTVVNHKVFNYLSNSGQFFIDSTSRGKFDYNYSIGGTKEHHTISGDFDDDDLDEIISAWEGNNSSINISVSQLDASNLAWAEDNIVNLDNVIYNSSPNSGSDFFRIKKGNFDNNSDDELILGFWNSDANLEIRIYDIDDIDLTIDLMCEVNDEYMNPEMDGNLILFDFAAGDFDGDYRDEIVLTGHRRIDQDNWSIFVKIYDVVQNGPDFNLIPKAMEENYFSSTDYSGSKDLINDLLIESGDFLNNTLDEFVVDFVIANPGSSQIENYLLAASVSLNLDTVKVNKNNLYKVFQGSGNSSIAVSLQTADLNNNGADEIIADGDGRINIIEADSNLFLSKITEASFGSYVRFDNRMVIADLNANTTDSLWHPEIIVGFTQYHQPDNSNNYSTLQFSVFEPIVDAAGKITSLQKRTSFIADSIDGGSTHYYSISAGDFDGGSIRLGKPKYFSATDIVQPLVILNAPPVHFDKFGDEIFDINRNFNGQSSEFYSKFYTASETDIEVSTKVHTGWTIGGKAEGGFSIPIVEVGVKAEIEGEYGKDFSKKNKTSNIYRVSQNITASSDDYIYATIIDYDIWEYPVFADDEIQGYMLVVEPGQPQRSWFPSKSPQAADYIPNHEVGNILSYSDIAAPTENGSLQQVVKWNTADQITLDGSPGFQYNWALQNETQSEVTETNEVHWNVKGEVSFDIPFKFLPNLEINGSYSSNTISTRKNSVKYKKGLNVHLGPIDLGVGETYYSVTPYAYWAKSGALVLDYAVDPRPSGINVPQTWWQERYSEKPDPALSLPWRLDPEKGFNITDEKRQQTKEIIFNPDKPKPGEIINIKTRIHNYSLLNTNGIINVKFFLGDPSNGGSLIQSTDGKDIFSTDDFIPSRGSKIISFDWQVPNDINSFPRIYVVVDPDNQVDEIHENNNIGWKVLSLFDGTTDLQENKEVPHEFSLSQNYPNPFNPITVIGYSISRHNSSSLSKTVLKVFDILGREVATLVNEIQKPGKYEIVFNASDLSSGVYFYELQTSEFRQTKKMLLMK